MALQAQLVFHVSHRGQHVALPVRTDSGAQAHVDDVGTGLGRGPAGGDEQAVGAVAVVVQHQFGPALAQGRHQLGHEARRADTGHILEAEDDAAGSGLFIGAHDVGHHAQDVLGHTQIVIDVEALGPRKGDGGLEDHVLAVHDHFGDGAHVLHMVQEVEAAHHFVVIADHLAGQAHEVARLRRVAQHVGGAHQQLLERLGSEALPLLRFGEGIGHVGQHGHMEVGATAVLDGEVTGIVQVGTDQAVFGQAEAVAGVGLGEVTRRGIRKVHVAAVADEVQQGAAVALRIGRRLAAQLAGDGRQHRIEGTQTGRGDGTVFPELHMGVVAFGGDLRHQAGQAFAFGGHVPVLHELGMVGHEVGVDLALAEQGMLEDLAVEGDGGLDAADDVFAQGAVHDAQGLFPVVGIGDEQGAGRVIVGRELVTGTDVGVQTHTGAARRHVTGDQTGIGSEVLLRVLAVDTHLHGTVGRTQVLFAVTQFRTKGHGDLLFHQVDAVAAFGDAVFHLQTGVDFDHVGRAVGRDQEFHRGQGVVTHGAHQATGVVLELFAQLAGHARPGRRRDLDELLMVALHGAVAFVKGKDIAVHVGDDLDLDVAHIGQELFHEQARIAEGGLGHGGGLEEGVFQLGFIVDGEDTAATAAAFGLEHDGQTDLGDQLTGGGDVHGPVRTGHHGDAQLAGHGAGLHFVAQQVHGFGSGTDKGDTGFLAALGETGVLRGKAPAGVDTDNAALAGFVDDAVNIQVSAGIGSEQNQFLGSGC